jgi:hypothetical protein
MRDFRLVPQGENLNFEAARASLLATAIQTLKTAAASDLSTMRLINTTLQVSLDYVY